MLSGPNQTNWKILFFISNVTLVVTICIHIYIFLFFKKNVFTMGNMLFMLERDYTFLPWEWQDPLVSIALFPFILILPF